MVGRYVKFLQEGLCSLIRTKTIDYKEFYFFVDLLAQIGLVLAIGETKIFFYQTMKITLIGVSVKSECELCRCGWSPYRAPSNTTQIETLETLDKAVSLHKLVVEVGQGLWLLGIHHDTQPEAQAGDVDGAFLYIDAIDVVLDDFFL